MISRILVPVDGSEHSKNALEFACDLAKHYDAEVNLLHVVQSVHYDRVMVLGASRVTIHMNQEEMEKAGNSVLEAANAIAEEQGVKAINMSIESGPPAETILAESKNKDIDLIVMGSRGLSDIGGLMLGSVSHKVNHLAKCTCVTVK